MNKRLYRGKTRLQILQGFGTVIQYIDGTISGNEFLDRSGNNYHLDIINNDISNDTFRKGIPYKSQALVAQKVANFGLIPDTNNFWFTSGGTPNQIPVTALFQNIDYGNITFTKHQAQVLQPSTGVELTEPSVQEIVTYSTALTGLNLTNANTYFGVPTKDPAAIWVAKTGNDTTGTGTEANPYLTIFKAYNTVASGSTIYVKTGVYTEEKNSTTLRYFYCDRVGTWTIKGLSNVVIRTISTSFVIRLIDSIMNFHRVTLDGETNTTDTVNFFANNTNTGNFYNCFFLAPLTNSIKQSSGAGTNTCLADACVFPANFPIVFFDSVTSVTNSLVNTTTLYTTGGTHNYNKGLIFTTYLGTSWVRGGTTVKWNNLKSKDGFLDYTLAGATNCSYNKYEIVWTADIGVSLLGILINNASCVPTITYNNIFCSATGVSRNITFISLPACITPIITNNVMNSESKTNLQHIVIDASAAGQGLCTVNYNVSINNSQSGIVISIGGETALSNKIDGSTFIGNYMIGSFYDHPTESGGSTHQCLMSGGKNFDIKYNYFGYSHIGLVVKTGGIADTYTANGVQYNVFVNNDIDLWVRGVHDLIINGNSHNLNSGFSGLVAANCVQIDENAPIPGNFSENVVVYNSIIQINNSATNVSCIYLDAHAEANGCKAVNTIFNNNGTGNKLINSYATIAATNLAGVTTNCLDTDPLYTNSATNDLTVTSASPAIGSGYSSLGTSYDDALDKTMSFPTPTIYFAPAITTKVQPVAWQIGAFI